MELEPANRLKDLRVAAGLSLEDLAQRSGVPKNSIHLIERGKQELTLGKMRQLANALKVVPSALLIDEDVELRAPGHAQEVIGAARQLSQESRSLLLTATSAVIALSRQIAAEMADANVLDGEPDQVQRFTRRWNAMSPDLRDRTLSLVEATGFGENQRTFR
jgi:transcriptional regulator with XRE-family HTH domain